MSTHPQSRRERPAKAPLSRAGIVHATIAVMRAEGLEKATMRRVAQELDTGAASLYVYVRNTAELHAAVLDSLIAPLTIRAVGDWRARLHALLGDYAAVLFSNPGLARSAVTLRPSGDHAVLLYDQLLGLLIDGGIDPARAAWGVDLLLQYVTSTAAEHSEPAPGTAVLDDGLDDLTRALHAADPVAAPHVSAHADALIGGTPADRVAWAIDTLLAGMAATPLPHTVPDSRSHSQTKDPS